MANDSQLAKLTEIIEGSTKWPAEQWEKLPEAQRRCLADQAIDEAVVEAVKLAELGVKLAMPALSRVEPPEPLEQLIEYAIAQVVPQIIQYVEFSEMGKRPPRL